MNKKNNTIARDQSKTSFVTFLHTIVRPNWSLFTLRDLLWKKINRLHRKHIVCQSLLGDVPLKEYLRHVLYFQVFYVQQRWTSYLEWNGNSLTQYIRFQWRNCSVIYLVDFSLNGMKMGSIIVYTTFFKFYQKLE